MSISDKDLAKVIEKPSETITEPLLKDHIDLSNAFIISPDLVDEVKAVSKNTKDTNKIFDAVEENAEFVGGMNALSKFFQENIKYPDAAQKANQSGKVFTQFIVNTDGSISDVTILKSVGFGCDEEAMRVIKLAKWIPGKHHGQVVRSRFTVPIMFSMASESPNSKFIVKPEGIRAILPNSKEYYDTVPETGNSKGDKSGSNHHEIDQQAEFSGGTQAFGKYLQENLKYPKSAQKANIIGKVYIQFIVNKDGSASDFKTVKGIGYGCDEEAMRVLKAVPKWNPGRDKGEVVTSTLIVPINFQLSE